ncbi:MAG TPA: hypothetical protein VFD27_12275 [Chthoniobacteraceae bacterium]|nr:hypothetical protein [Chthoniobacteraceae bacterium]
MPENEIIAEIHRTRAAIARECDYDVDKLFAYLRKKTAEFQAAGWEVVDIAAERREADQTCMLREEPPKS